MKVPMPWRVCWRRCNLLFLYDDDDDLDEGGSR